MRMNPVELIENRVSLNDEASVISIESTSRTFNDEDSDNSTVAVFPGRIVSKASAPCTPNDEDVYRGLAAGLPGSIISEGSPPRPTNDDEIYKALVADLTGIPCEWSSVIAPFLKYSVSEFVLKRIVKESAQKLGFWVPDDKAAKSFVRVIRQKLSEASSGFDKQISGESFVTRSSTVMNCKSIRFCYDRTLDFCEGSQNSAESAKAHPPNAEVSRKRQFPIAHFFFITVHVFVFGLYSMCYMMHGPPKSWEVIGLPILIARYSAYDACFWTGVLFLTMSRDLISFLAHLRLVKNSQLAMQFINCHKEIHIFSAHEVLLQSFVHALMHHVGTFVAFETSDTKELNEMLACAQQKSTLSDGYSEKGSGYFLKAFQFPACPLPEDDEIGYWDGVLSTPGITGYLLLIVICLLGWFSRQKKRKTGFRVFYALHHVLVPSWVVLLVLHGANDWMGLGFPMVILFAGMPIITYAWTRARRLYFCCRHGAGVTKAEKSIRGNLIRLDVELRSFYRRCQVGEFAYINIPSIGLTEWHPYTIANSSVNEDGSQKVTFCIMAVGKWTNKLHNLFTDLDERPKIHIDGPFYAPSVSMPQRSTVVGIGAGVGVTPFLSFLGSMVGTHATDHKFAHVFWMSAFATDFMLFQDLFCQFEAAAKADGRSCTFHLHATPQFGAWDGTGIGSVFELASRDLWNEWLLRLKAKGGTKPSFSLYKQPLHAVVSSCVLQSGNPLAVVIGSPDFLLELQLIGNSDLDDDVFVYFCGNPFLQDKIQTACTSLNTMRENLGQTQRYYFYFERYG